MVQRLSPMELRGFEAALQAQRQAARARVESLKRSFNDLVSSSEGSPPDDEHDPEGATIGFERAQVSALLAQAEQAAHDATDALGRIMNGTNGQCLDCG